MNRVVGPEGLVILRRRMNVVLGLEVLILTCAEGVPLLNSPLHVSQHCHLKPIPAVSPPKQNMVS